jgi:hypothetical protein
VERGYAPEAEIVAGQGPAAEEGEPAEPVRSGGRFLERDRGEVNDADRRRRVAPLQARRRERAEEEERGEQDQDTHLC